MKLTRMTTLPTGSVAFICISRRETIVRAFAAQHALGIRTTLVCGAPMKLVKTTAGLQYRVSRTYHTFSVKERR